MRRLTWMVILGVAIAAPLEIPTSERAFAGCNPGTQDIADCISVPRAPTPQGYSGGGGGYYGGGGGGGGGNNAAAALGAAATVLGILGDMADEADRAEQVARANQDAARNAEAARIAAQRAYCAANYNQASDDVATGNHLIDRWQAGDAVPYYRRAIAFLSRCGDTHNIDIVRRNLREAQRQYAAVAPDNRVDDALQRYGDRSPYNGLNNPFQGNDAAGDHAPSGSIVPNDVLNAARQRCAPSEQDASRWNSCMRTQEARAILDGDPAIRETCGLETNLTARATCAINEYVAKLKERAVAVDENCYFRKDGAPCYPGGGSSAAANASGGKPNLRDRLRKAMSEQGGASDTNDADTPQSDVAATVQTPPMQATPTPDEAKVASDAYNADDPLQNYLHNRNSSSGGLNSGDLGKAQPGMTGLTPSWTGK